MNSRESRTSTAEVRRFYGMFASSQFIVDSSIWSFYFTQSCGLSLASAVAVHATTTIASGMLDLPTGSWADRFGRRRIVFLGFATRAVAALIMLAAPSLPMLFIAALLAGFGWAQLSGASEALLHDNLKAVGAEASFKQHMANVVIASYIARTAAFALSGFLFVIAPWLPYATLLATLLGGMLLASSLPERPYEKAESQADLEHIASGARVYLRAPDLLRFALVSLAIGIVSEQLWFSLQPLLSHANFSPPTVGLAYAAGSLGSAFGAYAAKKLLLRHKEELALAAAVACFGLGALLFSCFGGKAACATALLVTCIGFGASWTATSGVLNANVPSSHRAVCLSLLSALGTTLQGLLGSAIGLAFDRFGSSAVPATVAICAALLVPAAFRTVKTLKYRGGECRESPA